MQRKPIDRSRLLYHIWLNSICLGVGSSILTLSAVEKQPKSLLSLFGFIVGICITMFGFYRVNALATRLARLHRELFFDWIPVGRYVIADSRIWVDNPTHLNSVEFVLRPSGSVRLMDNITVKIPLYLLTPHELETDTFIVEQIGGLAQAFVPKRYFEHFYRPSDRIREDTSSAPLAQATPSSAAS